MFVSCRNGRFLLQSSRNILEPSLLTECEEALNQGSMTAAEVFISLRSKSTLHLFASIGRFLGLEVNVCSFLLSLEEEKQLVIIHAASFIDNVYTKSFLFNKDYYSLIFFFIKKEKHTASICIL